MSSSEARDFQKSKGKGKGKPPPKSTKLRGLEKDSPETRVSKTITWLLRHGAANEGLGIREDGYVRVDELLSHPKLKGLGLNIEKVQAVVAADEKKRYDLRFEDASAEGSTSAAADSALDATTGATQASGQEEQQGLWWIKANQGHSMKTVKLELKSILSLDDIPSRIALHGTTEVAWRSIEKQGLSKMKRNHIHLAQGVSKENAISGLRKSAQILIFIDIPKALDAGIQFFLSDNGVVLTEGDASGFLKSEFFSRVENRLRVPLPGWEGSGPIDSKAVEAAVSTGRDAGSSSSTAVSGVEKAIEGLSVASEPENR
ncbi:hypothetical protein MD484_g3283, partial [Candolleomyces efflorescens]